MHKRKGGSKGTSPRVVGAAPYPCPFGGGGRLTPGYWPKPALSVRRRWGGGLLTPGCCTPGCLRGQCQATLPQVVGGSGGGGGGVLNPWDGAFLVFVGHVD